MSDAADVDYYALLGIDPTATSAEIRKAYRQKSLKVHPDRVRRPSRALPDLSTHRPPRRSQNPDNPTAAALFHELTLAADLLSDPTKRAALDAKLAAAQARAQRFAALDSKRKALASDLEQREREYKRHRAGEATEQSRKRQELERLREEGRRMREERAGKAALAGREQEDEVLRRAREAAERRAREEGARAGEGGGGGGEGPVVDLGPLDKTLKVKWLKSRHPSLVSPDAVESFLTRTVAPQKADIDSVVLSSKTLANPTKGKHGSGVVAFRTLSAAVRVVRGKEADPEGVWDGFEVDWAGGAPPAALGPGAGAGAEQAPRAASPPAPTAAAPLPTSVRPLPLSSPFSLSPLADPALSLRALSADLHRPLFFRRRLDPRAVATEGARETHGGDEGRGRGGRGGDGAVRTESIAGAEFGARGRDAWGRVGDARGSSWTRRVRGRLRGTASPVNP